MEVVLTFVDCTKVFNCEALCLVNDKLHVVGCSRGKKNIVLDLSQVISYSVRRLN